ncbi:MAG: enamine deaminase RidA (YjgF/YER057c/UK114 family) [Hyphomicrobiaceae bacterium]|jgi:enamine deaminase RidA (YjgF/YER057c/UK114 family)
MKSERSANPRIAVSTHPIAETIQARGCSIVMRRVEGQEATELFLHCQPAAASAREQAESIYLALVDLLKAEGGSFASVVSETLFMRSMQADIAATRAARQKVLEAEGLAKHRPATTAIEQPPLRKQACLEVSVQAVVPRNGPLRAEVLDAQRSCACTECASAHGLRFQVGEEVRLYAGGLCGHGATAYEQTLTMFSSAEDLLQKAGMEFSDVVRTWIHIRDIDRDYDDLNRGRREFFEARGVDPVPASTGIGGGPVSEQHHLSLGIYAVKAESPPLRTVMTTPTLNEAPTYGADFVRGMKMVEANKVALHISGTASIDEAGLTAHVGDFDAQADRMLVNIAALLEGQGADFGDVVSAITYLKNPADVERLRAKLHGAGFDDIPIAMVNADVCRPELLCETEVFAVLPVPASSKA